MSQPYNVIFLIFDTLRSDHLRCYGAETETHAFEQAADDGVAFASAFGVAPGTPITHASIYSGQYPSEHGVTGQYINVPEETPVVADWFRDAGYETFGITGPPKMGSDWGYDRGFDELFEPYNDLPSFDSWRAIHKSLFDGRFRRSFLRQLVRGGYERTRFKFELLEDRIESDLDAPFFALCNFTTVHLPYDPPRPYKEQATPEFSRPRWFFLEHLLDNRGSVENPDIRLERVLNLMDGGGIGRYLAAPDYLNQAEIQLLRDWYTASVEYLNDELHRFLEYYRRNLSEETILVLTADHGEQLGEHGLWEHSHFFYDETLSIPLILVGPGLPRGVRRSDLVSQVDLFDTLCDLCGLSKPGTTSGSSLFAGKDRDAVYMEYGKRDTSAFSEDSNIHGRFLNREQLSDFCAGRKAMRTKQYRFEIDSNGRERLFDLPGGSEVSDPDPEIVSDFRSQLSDTIGDEFGIWPEGNPTDITEQVEENLRQLGYLS